MTKLIDAIIGDDFNIRELVAKYGDQYVQAFVAQRRGLRLQEAFLPNAIRIPTP